MIRTDGRATVTRAAPLADGSVVFTGQHGDGARFAPDTAFEKSCALGGAYFARGTADGALDWVVCPEEDMPFDHVRQMVQLASGDLVVAGSVLDRDGATVSVVVVARYTLEGALVWGVRIADAHVTDAQVLLADDGTLVVVGEYADAMTLAGPDGGTLTLPAVDSDVFLARFDESGAALDLRSGGGLPLQVPLGDVARLPDGRIAVPFDTFPDAGPSPQQAFIALYDADLSLDGFAPLTGAGMGTSAAADGEGWWGTGFFTGDLVVGKDDDATTLPDRGAFLVRFGADDAPTFAARASGPASVFAKVYSGDDGTIGVAFSVVGTSAIDPAPFVLDVAGFAPIPTGPRMIGAWVLLAPR